MVFSHLAGQVLLSSDIIILRHISSSEEVSYLSLVHSISLIMIILVQTLNTAWGPWFYDMLKINQTNRIKRAYSVYVWAIVACTFGLLLLGPEIIQVLGGEKYGDSLNALPPYILCGIFTAFTSQFTSLELYNKKPEYAAILAFIVAVINIIFDIIAVKIWGYLAVCYVTMLCQLLLIGLHYRATKRMKVQDILPRNRLLSVLCISIALIPISFLLYKNNIVRYIFAVAVAGIIVTVGLIKRRQIKEFVKSKL